MLYMLPGTLHRPLYLVLRLVFGLQHIFGDVFFLIIPLVMLSLQYIYWEFFIFVHCGQ